MIILDTTTKSLELETFSNVSTDYYISYVDITTTSAVPAANQGTVATATTTTLAAAPSASTQRQIKYLTVKNKSTVTAQTVKIKLDVSGTEYDLSVNLTLQPGESLEYSQNTGFAVMSSAGAVKVLTQTKAASEGRNFAFMKVGSASEAAGIWYCHAKDAGFPGAWVWYRGVTGLNGNAVTGTNGTGLLLYDNATGGANYLTNFVVSSSTVHAHYLFDILWINTGIVTTSTGVQTINSVSWPARDLYGATGGYGVWVGVLVHTATTNSAAFSNGTILYTNHYGQADRTGALINFPATAVAGTVVWYTLSGGDKGVQSIQSIRFPTLPSGGPISLIAAVPIAGTSMAIANQGANAPIDPTAGVRLYDGTALVPMYIGTTTTATNTVGSYTISTR